MRVWPIVAKWLGRLSAVIILFAIWLLFPQVLDSGIVRSHEEIEVLLPDYLMRDFRYASVRGQVRDQEIFAKVANFYLAEERAEGDQVRANLYDASGAITRLEGDRGSFLVAKQYLKLVGNVRTESANGFLLSGTEAEYFLSERRAVANQPVEGRTRENDVRVWADTAVAKLDQQEVSFKKNVRTEYQPPKQEVLKIRSDRAVLEQKSQTITYFDQVRMDQGGLKMTSLEASLVYEEKQPERSADRAGPVETKSRVNSVRYLLARKDVEIRESSSRLSQSQQAEFFLDTNSIILTGFPSVYDGRDTVTGDRLTLYRSTGVMEVTAANAAFAEKPSQNRQGSAELSGEDLELVVPSAGAKSNKRKNKP